jgi:hypothetical protein
MRITSVSFLIIFLVSFLNAPFSPSSLIGLCLTPFSVFFYEYFVPVLRFFLFVSFFSIVSVLSLHTFFVASAPLSENQRNKYFGHAGPTSNPPPSSRPSHQSLCHTSSSMPLIRPAPLCFSFSIALIPPGTQIYHSFFPIPLIPPFPLPLLLLHPTHLTSNTTVPILILHGTNPTSPNTVSLLLLHSTHHMVLLQLVLLHPSNPTGPTTAPLSPSHSSHQSHYHSSSSIPLIPQVTLLSFSTIRSYSYFQSH